MPSTLDMKAVVRHNLLQDPGVRAFIVDAGGGVFSGHDRASLESSKRVPTVIMDVRGGKDFAQAPVGRKLWHLYAYSNKSEDEAGQLYEAVKAVMQRKGLVGRLDELGARCESVCVYAIEDDGPVDGWNEDVASWFKRGTWLVWGIG